MAELTAEDGSGSRRQMRTVSIRLPQDVIDAAQAMADDDGTRYTIFLRTMLIRAMREARERRERAGRSNGAA